MIEQGGYRGLVTEVGGRYDSIHFAYFIEFSCRGGAFGCAYYWSEAGRIAGVAVGDIDFAKGVLHMRRSVNFVSGPGYQEGEPKTRAGRRDIMLPDVTVEALKVHRALQEQARLKMGKEWREQGIVFCNIYGGFSNPSRVTALFQRLLKKAGLPSMRFHDLRQSAATILRASGVDLKTIQELLGHSTIARTADIYSSVLSSERREAANKMDGLFKRS